MFTITCSHEKKKALMLFRSYMSSVSSYVWHQIKNITGLNIKTVSFATPSLKHNSIWSLWPMPISAYYYNSLC